MSRSFAELRERLLRAGVAPQHVRRYLAELADHLADLRAEEERAGASAVDAERSALARLGGIEALAAAMIDQRRFQALSARAPWAAFALAPLAVLAGAYFIAGTILLTGWKIFLPQSASPFVGPLHGLAIPYFAVGRMDYFLAPVLVGWAIAILAARQRSPRIWPIAGLVLIALAGGGAHFNATASAVAGGARHFAVGFGLLPPPGGLADDLRHAALIFVLTALPYLLWRLRRSESPTATI